MNLKRLIPLLFLASFSLAQEIAVSSFKGLNTDENSTIIDPGQAQDLLNVDVTRGGNSIKKRMGYGVYKTFANGSSVHGGIHFYDSTGNEVQVWSSSRSVVGIISDAAPTVIYSTATVNSTMDCADSQGFAYCVNTSRDYFLKTNGQTITSSSSSVTGTMVEFTPERLVLAGVAGNPNTLYISGSNNFNTFATGINNTDPFTEVIASPGSKVTHIRWACGKLLFWKDQSFGYMNFSNQYDVEIKTVSDTVGTFDNTSSIDPGGNVWFRAQDGHIWRYDCSALTKESIEITPTVLLSQKRTGNSWTQTNQSDFQSSSFLPTNALNTTISPGDVVPSSYTRTDTLDADFSLGTASNVLVTSNLVWISTNNTNITNYSFENLTGAAPDNWTVSPGASWVGTSSLGGIGSCGTVSPTQGSNFVKASAHTSASSMIATLIDKDGAALETITLSSVCGGWKTYSFSYATSRKRVQIRFTSVSNSITSESFITSANNPSFDWQIVQTAPTDFVLVIDNVAGGKSSISAGTFTSYVFDTGFGNKTAYVMPTTDWLVDDFIPYFEMQSSTSSTGAWSKVLASTGVSVNTERYIRYVSSFTVGATDDASSKLFEATIVARSSGTFYSALKNAPNLTAWSSFSVNYQKNGGSHTFYMRSSTNTFTVLSSTPLWVLQTEGSFVSASTGTYFQFRDDFTVPSSTATPTLSDFTVNWYEGNATDQAYSIYFDDAIWFAVTYGAGVAANNYIFKFDLINNIWTLYNIAMNGMVVQNNTLFFGDPNSASIYQFGKGKSDNSNTVNAYWKSKDYSGSDPFLENQYNRIDSFLKRDQGNSLTVTYTLSNSTSTNSYTVNLSSSTQSVIRNKKSIGPKIGSIFNIQYGDTSATSAWELFGFHVNYDPLSYRPSQ